VFGRGGSENRRQIVLFLGVGLGAACKVVYDAFSNAGLFGWKIFAVALIASLVVFPQLYYSGALNKRRLTFAHWALAFQNGFFWSAFSVIKKPWNSLTIQPRDHALTGSTSSSSSIRSGTSIRPPARQSPAEGRNRFGQHGSWLTTAEVDASLLSRRTLPCCQNVAALDRRNLKAPQPTAEVMRAS
jgi:hypothetical protein